MKERARRTPKTARVLRAHAHRRAETRLGIRFTLALNREWVQQIQHARARHLERQSHRVSLWAVRHDGRWVPVVYDRQRKAIVTVLPLDALERFGAPESWGVPDAG